MQGETVVKQKLSVDGQEWLMTCVSMGNPHAITYGTSTNSNLKVNWAAQKEPRERLWGQSVGALLV